MLSHKSILVFFVFVAVLIVTAWAFDTNDPPDAVPKFDVSPSRASLDFGEVWEDSQFIWPLKIENRTAEVAIFDEFKLSCSCLSVSPASLTIPPGGTQELQLTIDLSTKAQNSQSAHQDAMNFDVGVQPVIRGEYGPKLPSPWIIKGKVKQIIQFDQPVVDFGRHSDRSAIAPRRVKVISQVPLEGLSSKPTQDGAFRVEIDAAGANSNHYELAITPPPRKSTGIMAI
jgi:hypothetical protein